MKHPALWLLGLLSVVVLTLALGEVGADNDRDSSRDARRVADLAARPELGSAPTEDGTASSRHASLIKTPRAAEEATRHTALQAVARALPFLAQEGVDWMDGKVSVQGGEGCVSCHHVSFALWSHAEASAAGLEVDQRAMDALSQRAADFVLQPDTARPASLGPLLLAREALAEDASRPQHAQLLSTLLEQKEDEGHWRARGQFFGQQRPEEESDMVTSHWTLLLLGEAPSAQSALRQGLQAASTYREGTSTEWLLTRWLLELQQEGQGSSVAGQADWLLDELLQQQNPDGGWGWAAGDPSNAYSTGQAVYALAQARSPRLAGSLARAVQHLADTQSEEGGWLVPSRLSSIEASEEKDLIYRYWGSAWAAIGMARWLAENPS